MPHLFVVRLSNHERIFSQLPLFKKGDLLNASLENRERGFLGPNDAEIIQEFQMRHTRSCKLQYPFYLPPIIPN
jgi:hypothetical protein